MRPILYALAAALLFSPSLFSAQELILDFPETNAPVRALYADAGILYIGGDFTEVDGLPRQRLAAIDIASGAVLPWSPVADDAVLGFATGKGVVYICGFFSEVNGVARNTLAAIDATSGMLTAWNPEIFFPGIPGMQTGMITSIATEGGNIYLAGYFLGVEGSPRDNLAALDADGNLLPWNPSTNIPVEEIYIYDGLAYISGPFSAPGFTYAAIDLDNGWPTNWAPGPNNSGNPAGPIIKDGSSIYLAGQFTAMGGTPINYVAKVDDQAGSLLPWNAGFTTQFPVFIRALAVGNGAVYVGGNFSELTGPERNNLAAFDTTAGNLLAWAPEPDGAVAALYIHENILFVGGYFDHVYGQSQSRKFLAAYTLPISDVDDAVPEAGVLVFPNPTQGQLFLELPAGPYRFRLFDCQARLVRSYEGVLPKDNFLSLEELPTGVYFLEVRGQGFSNMKRVVVVHQ